MEKIVNMLQKGYVVVALVILFGTSPYMPSYLQHAYQRPVAEMYTWGLFFVSIVLMRLCFYYLTSKMIVSRPWYMLTLTFAAAQGLAMGFSALLGMYGFSAGLYLYWKGGSAAVVPCSDAGGTDHRMDPSNSGKVKNSLPL